MQIMLFLFQLLYNQYVLFILFEFPKQLLGSNFFIFTLQAPKVQLESKERMNEKETVQKRADVIVIYRM